MIELPPFREKVTNPACHLFFLWLFNCICLSLWCWELDVDLIVSAPDFTYLLFKEGLWKGGWQMRFNDLGYSPGSQHQDCGASPTENGTHCIQRLHNKNPNMTLRLSVLYRIKYNLVDIPANRYLSIRTRGQVKFFGRESPARPSPAPSFQGQPETGTNLRPEKCLQPL